MPEPAPKLKRDDAQHHKGRNIDHSASWFVDGGQFDGMRIAIALHNDGILGIAVGRDGASPEFIPMSVESWQEIRNYIDSRTLNLNQS